MTLPSLMLKGSTSLWFLKSTLEASEYKKLEASLRPAQLSSLGFLGKVEDVEPLLHHDYSLLVSRGISFEQIADRIDSLVDRLVHIHKQDTSSHITSKIVSLENTYFIKMSSLYRGTQECPFEPFGHSRCDVERSCYNVVLKHRPSGQILRFPGLISHLMRRHEFCEGFESPYRFDLAKALKILNIKPGVSCKAVKKFAAVWQLQAKMYQSEKLFSERFAQASKEPYVKLESSDKKMILFVSKFDLLSEGFPIGETQHLYIFTLPGFVNDCDLSVLDIKLKISDFSHYGRDFEISAFVMQKTQETVLGEHDVQYVPVGKEKEALGAELVGY